MSTPLGKFDPEPVTENLPQDNVPTPEPEVVEPVEPQEPEKQEVQAEEPQEEVAQKPSYYSKEENLRVLRERAERAERERDELVRSQARPQTQEEEPDDLPANDDFVEVKHVRKLQSEVRQLKKELNASAAKAAEARLYTQYPDFDSVVNQENLEALRSMEPEIAASINATTDLYTQAKVAYKWIKKLELDQSNLQKEQKIVKKNSIKPKTAVSIAPTQGKNPLTQANVFMEDDYSEESLSETWKEMKKVLGSD